MSERPYDEDKIAQRDKDLYERRLREVLEADGANKGRFLATDYYFFEVSCGARRVYDKPELSGEERDIEHSLRHEAMALLYEHMEPAFDISPAWPPEEADL